MHGRVTRPGCEYSMQIKRDSKYSCCRKDNVSVWWPKVHNISPATPTPTPCVDHHCASVWDTSLCQRITLAKAGLFPPTQRPLQLQSLTLYSSTYSTQGRRLNRDSSYSWPSQRIRAMFSLEWRCSNNNNTAGTSQYRSQSSYPTIHC